MSDLVNHPSHYNFGKIEVIEAIEDWKLSFHRGNAIKYIVRAGKKNSATEIEDFKKAIWYLNREMELIQAKQELKDATQPNEMEFRSDHFSKINVPSLDKPPSSSK